MSNAPLSEDERRAAYLAQQRALRLPPWVEPPCVQDPDVPLRGTADEARMMRLLRAMLAAGVSRWSRDPLGDLAAAKRKPKARAIAQVTA